MCPQKAIPSIQAFYEGDECGACYLWLWVASVSSIGCAGAPQPPRVLTAAGGTAQLLGHHAAKAAD